VKRRETGRGGQGRAKYLGVAGGALTAAFGLTVLFSSNYAVGQGDAGVSPPAAALGSAEEWQGFIDKNCIACHSERLQSGGVVLAKAALSPIGAKSDLWERVIRKVSAGEMPPPSVRNRPDAHQSAAFVGWLTRTLDEYAAANPNAGAPTVRRLTRVEYSNAVRDILGVDLKAGAQLPPDTVTNGFNNNGDTLSLSPLLMEKYMLAASQVTRVATGDRTLPRTVYTFTPPQKQDLWRVGLPFGARGVPATEHYFPADGEYDIRVFTDLTTGGRLPETEGVRYFRQRVTLTAGMHRVSAVVPEEGAAAQGPITDLPGWAGGLGGPLDPLRSATRKPTLDIRVDGKRVGRFEVKAPTAMELGTPTTVSPGAPWIRRMEIDGPYNATGPGKTPSRAQIFVCTPKAPREETACARRILTTVTRRAFRREVAARDVEPFMAIYSKARTKQDFESSIQQSLQGVLVSPGFLFRVEREPTKTAAGLNYALNDYELATRLSFFLWNSIPDERLLDLAKAGRLKNVSVLEAETKRMLRDPKAEALVDNFGMQLFGLQDLDATLPDKVAYNTFNTTLRDDMGEEARRFLKSVLLQNRSVVDLVGADYTYLNERLAKHYGVKGVTGPEFRRVSFEKTEPRGGVLGMGAVLLVTSHTNMTSPVLRGKWVLSNLLNAPPSPPPPGVPALVATNPSGRRLTGREQMEQHRTNPVCSSCHARMDPYGFAMENYDVTGRWRDADEGGAIKPAVLMPDGSGFSGPVGLKQRLLSQRDEFARAMTQRLMIYALGRRLNGSDVPTVRKIMVETKPTDYHFEDLVLQVVRTDQFRMRKKANTNGL
jgi:mono/diheme cytochrome c family protein